MAEGAQAPRPRRGEQVGHKPGSKVIVFAELRDTVEFLADLCRAEGIEMDRFTGSGRRRGGRG